MDKCKCDWGPRVWWDPPLCEGGGGFDGLLAPEKKFGKRLTRPPAKGEEQEYLHLWSDHHVSPHHSRVSKDEFLQRLHLLGFSPWSAHRVWWISCAWEKISHRKEFDPLALWKKRNHVDVDEDDDNEKGIWPLPVKSPPTEALLPLHAPHFSTAAKSWGKIFLEIFSRSFSVDTKLVLSESKWYEMKMITFVTSARSALF